MKKKIALFTLATMMVISLAACGGKAKETSANKGDSGDGSKITIGYSFANLDENNKRSMDAVQKRVDEINEERDDIQVEFIYTDAQASVDKQISDVESMIAQNPDLILVSAVDNVGSVPAAQAVDRAGIICVDDRGMEDESITFQFQGMDENAIKEMKKEYIKDYLEANPDVTLNFGLLYGMAAQTQQLIRNDDIKELAEEMPDRVKILDAQYADWSTDKATSITEDWMQRYPEMNAISAASDDMILGAINALSSTGKNSDDFLTMGVDGTKIGMQLVEEGKLDVTIKARQTFAMAQFVDVAIQAVEGDFSEEYYTPGTEALIAVTKENVAESKELD